MRDLAGEREGRAKARRAAGWDPALVGALDILEYGCDEGDYDDEATAVLAVVEERNALRGDFECLCGRRWVHTGGEWQHDDSVEMER